MKKSKKLFLLSTLGAATITASATIPLVSCSVEDTLNHNVDLTDTQLGLVKQELNTLITSESTSFENLQTKIKEFINSKFPNYVSSVSVTGTAADANKKASVSKVVINFDPTKVIFTANNTNPEFEISNNTIVYNPTTAINTNITNKKPDPVDPSTPPQEKPITFTKDMLLSIGIDLNTVAPFESSNNYNNPTIFDTKKNSIAKAIKPDATAENILSIQATKTQIVITTQNLNLANDSVGVISSAVGGITLKAIVENNTITIVNNNGQNIFSAIANIDINKQNLNSLISITKSINESMLQTQTAQTVNNFLSYTDLNDGDLKTKICNNFNIDPANVKKIEIGLGDAYWPYQKTTIMVKITLNQDQAQFTGGYANDGTLGDPNNNKKGNITCTLSSELNNNINNVLLLNNYPTDINVIDATNPDTIKTKLQSYYDTIKSIIQQYLSTNINSSVADWEQGHKFFTQTAVDKQGPSKVPFNTTDSWTQKIYNAVCDLIGINNKPYLIKNIEIVVQDTYCSINYYALSFKINFYSGINVKLTPEQSLSVGSGSNQTNQWLVVNINDGKSFLNIMSNLFYIPLPLASK